METNVNIKKILLVDDEPGIIDLYSEVLRDAGFDVDTASNGDEALQKAEGGEYALILLDIMMNEGPDGIECLKLIKSNADKYKNPIVVMLTNLAITNNVKDAYDYGAEGYLIKLALSNDQLVKKVKGFLNGFGGN
jgi:CheY-like chemotaxis protein